MKVSTAPIQHKARPTAYRFTARLCVLFFCVCCWMATPVLSAQVLTERELKPITQQLASLDKEDRQKACQQLMELGGRASKALPFLQVALQRESDLAMRELIRATINRIQGVDQKDNLYLRIREIDNYIKGLQHSNRSVRRQAATLLASYGADAAHAIPGLKRLANSDPDEFNRRMALQSIEKIQAAVKAREEKQTSTATTQPAQHEAMKLSEADQLVYDQLRIMLDEDIPERRLQGLKGMQSLGAKVWHLRDLFKKMALEDQDAAVRAEAGITLREVLAHKRKLDRAPETERQLRIKVYALIADLGSGEATVRLKAVKELGELGAMAKPALGKLEQMILDSDERVVISNAAKAAVKKIKGEENE